MRFRPCIDIHNGCVKQIVGGSLRDGNDKAKENFASAYGAEYYAGLYRKDGLAGGHIILLNPVQSRYYEKTKEQALSALLAYPGGMQIGGGITADNAKEYIEAGASHVIVTSYVFQEGRIYWERLKELSETVGKERLVIDLSCRRKDGCYYVVTDRWQTFTEAYLGEKLLYEMSAYCDEFLVHGVDVEGKAAGIEEELAEMLGKWSPIPATYAGGIRSLADIELLRKKSGGAVDFTVGSALDLFGGTLSYDIVKNI